MSDQSYVAIGVDDQGDPHHVWATEATEHEASPRCGCNPDFLGDAWVHHIFDSATTEADS